MSITLHTVYTLAGEDYYCETRHTSTTSKQDAWAACRDNNSPDTLHCTTAVDKYYGGIRLNSTNAPIDWFCRMYQGYLRFDTSGIADGDDILAVDLVTQPSSG